MWVFYFFLPNRALLVSPKLTRPTLFYVHCVPQEGGRMQGWESVFWGGLQQPTTNNQQPTTNNQQPTTNNQQPTTNNQQPYFRLINGLIGSFLAFYSALGLWLMAQGSWLMPQGSWLKAHGQEQIGTRARGLGDPEPNFYWPWAMSLEAWAMSLEPWAIDNRSIIE